MAKSARTSERPEPPRHEEIAERAYLLYLARGGAPGQEIEDWLRAEQELTGATSATRSTSATARPAGKRAPRSTPRTAGVGRSG
jgi:hypothetical protein